MTKALVVLSGGQDSTTCLFIAKKRHEKVCAITFDYGQRHEREILAAAQVAKLAGVEEHRLVDVGDVLKSVSPLTSRNKLEQYENPMQMAEVIGNRIEKTFVPMRNQLFLTIAMNHAVEMGCEALFTGVCQEDNANYPDCRAEFIKELEWASNLGLGTADINFGPGEGFIYIETPLMNYSKKETCQIAYSDDDCWRALMYTHTSYAGDYPPLDMNHASVLRADGFEKAGLPDPLILRAWDESLMELPRTENYHPRLVKRELARLKLDRRVII